MLSRRAALLAAAAASSIFVTPAFTTETKPFTRDDFAAAQKAGKPIFVGDPCHLVPDLQGAEADPERAHG